MLPGQRLEAAHEASPEKPSFTSRLVRNPVALREQDDIRGEAPRPTQNGMSSSMSLLRPPPPAATARRGALLTGPEEPKSPPGSSPKLPPPPPPPRPSSIVSVELKPCSTTSVEYFSAPCWSVHLRVCSAPSM